MLKYIVTALVSAVVLTTGGIWGLVSTDHWPLDDKRPPATDIYALNRAAAKWLVDHGEPAPIPAQVQELSIPHPEAITAADLAKVEVAIRNDPRLRDRVITNPGMQALIPKPRG